MQRRRAMSSDHASDVKVSGHRNEVDFAALIHGSLNLDAPRDKTDVIDSQGRSHSVKAGKWSQIFLYSQGQLPHHFARLGNVADLMVACLDAYPATYAEYEADKMTAKLNLQPQMSLLRDELDQPGIFPAFLDKSVFGVSDADYLSVFPGPANQDRARKVFHIFHKSDVVSALSQDITLLNSKSRGTGQMDDQKVTFRSKLHRKNIGELEDRHDSPVHYREMKFRLNILMVFAVLNSAITSRSRITPQLITYGRAVSKFQLSS